MTTSATTPLRFYKASAVKRMCFNSGFVEPNSPLFVAKWTNLYVIARDAQNFFIIEEAKAPEYVRTERDEKNKREREKDERRMKENARRMREREKAKAICTHQLREAVHAVYKRAHLTCYGKPSLEDLILTLRAFRRRHGAAATYAIMKNMIDRWNSATVKQQKDSESKLLVHLRMSVIDILVKLLKTRKPRTRR